MCWKCGQGFERKPGFRDTCEKCGADLHACRNCRFYKPGSYRDCAESIGEAVVDKERNNFCEWFVPSDAKPGKKGNSKDAFDALFS